VARLDWAALSSKVTSDAGKMELGALRATYSEIQKSVASAPSSTPSVDWAKWKSTIKTPGVVEGFEKAFAGVNVPQMEDSFSAEMDAKFATAISNAEGLAASSTARIAELEAQLDELDNAKNWSEVTVEEELAANPEIAAEIEAEIEQNKW